MKKVISIFAFVFLSLVLVGLVSAADYSPKTQACSPNITLLNQDPYPAIPGEYVKLVFKLEGLASVECRDIALKVLEEYPIKLDPGVDNTYYISSGNYANDYGSAILVPFKVRVDENALDGDNDIKLVYYDSRYPNSTYTVKTMNLNIKSVDTAFELSVKDYDSATQTLTLDIINVGKNDIDALAIDLRSQSNFQAKGSTRSIVGSLNSGEDTSFTFEGIPSDGEINLELSYNDLQNVRKSLTESVKFDSSLFKDRVKDQKPSNTGFYVFLLIVVALIVFWYISRRNKKKKMAQMQALSLKRK